MSLLFGPRQEKRADNPTDSLYELARRRIGLGGAGVQVTEQSALTHSAVFECVDLIADLVSTFPVKRYRVVDRVKIPATGLSVIDNPSTECDDVNWRRVIVVSWLLRGWAPGLVTGMRGAQPAGIELIHPDRVRADRVRKDAPARWYLDGKETERWPAGQLWIADGKRWFPEDVTGRSVLEYARLEAGLGLAARQYGADFYKDGGHPTAILKAAGQPAPDAARRIKQRFMDARVGNREPIVLGDGWDYDTIQVSPTDAAFLDSIKANRTMIAGFFRVPPELIGAPSGTGMTYSNVEHRGIDLLRFCVGQWVTRMEKTLTALTVRPEVVRLNLDALLRPDSATRWRIHDMAIRMGAHSVNQVLEIEDEAPIDDGDKHLWPPYRSQLSEPELIRGPDTEGEGGPDAD